MADTKHLSGTPQHSPRSTAAPHVFWRTTLHQLGSVVSQTRAAVESLRCWLPGRWMLVYLAGWSLIVALLSGMATLRLLWRFARGAALPIWAGLLALTFTLLFLASGGMALLTVRDLAWGVRSWRATSRRHAMLARRSRRGRSGAARRHWNRYRHLPLDESSLRLQARAVQPRSWLANRSNTTE